MLVADLLECQQHRYAFFIFILFQYSARGFLCVFVVQERDWSGTLGSGEIQLRRALAVGPCRWPSFFWKGWSVSMSDWVRLGWVGAVAVGVWSISLATYLTRDPHAPPAFTPRTSTLSLSSCSHSFVIRFLSVASFISCLSCVSCLLLVLFHFCLASILCLTCLFLVFPPSVSVHLCLSVSVCVCLFAQCVFMMIYA